MTLHRAPLLLLVLLSACVDADGRWSGETDSNHSVSLEIAGSEVSGRITVNPDNVHGCDGAGASRLTFDVDGTLSGSTITARLSNRSHPSDATLEGTLDLFTGQASGVARGGVELYGISFSGRAGSCDARFEDGWAAQLEGFGLQADSAADDDASE